MPNLNRVMLMGNLTRDPECKFLPSGIAIVGFGLAINRRWKNTTTGEQQEEVTFIDVEFFGKTGEVINQHLKKGRPLYVEGRLKLDQWQDKEGQNRSKLKVVGESFEFIDGKPQSDEPPAPQPASKPKTLADFPKSGGNRMKMPEMNTHPPIEESDIPF